MTNQAKGGNAMTPAYGRWRSLDHYLRSRASDRETNLTEISESLDWGRSYLNSIASEQFRPSIDRCRQIATHFDDDPSIILTLAGYMDPPPRDNDVSAAVASTIRGLRPHRQRLMLDLAEFLKTRETTLDTKPEADELYVELPDGRSLTVHLDGDPSLLDEPILRVTLRAALNATLARE